MRPWFPIFLYYWRSQPETIIVIAFISAIFLQLLILAPEPGVSHTSTRLTNTNIYRRRIIKYMSNFLIKKKEKKKKKKNKIKHN
ncbi:hypothetical protein PUN28_004086 [Cardiocondyla obscurior]|uniref:Uncharacterized protein n=1 Tax=Cardiocondyla obscurior TaxID=286306 RepID=A0AAW2GPH1_9HYME